MAEKSGCGRKAEININSNMSKMRLLFVTEHL